MPNSYIIGLYWIYSKVLFHIKLYLRVNAALFYLGSE